MSKKIDKLTEEAKYYATAFELIANAKHVGSMSEVVRDTLKFLDKAHTKLQTKIEKLMPDEQPAITPDAIIEPTESV